MREMLDIASVEGDLFTTEVLSDILGVDPEMLLRTFSRELEGRYKVVHERGEILVGTQRLNQFQFRHGLFREYLYNQLNAGERRRYHRMVGRVLERLLKMPEDFTTEPQENLSNPFGPALVHHFWHGEDWSKAARYALQMGKMARDQFAMREAIAYFEKAIQAIDRTGKQPGNQMVDAILNWAEAAHQYVPYADQLDRLTRADLIARGIGDQHRLIQVLHTTANVYLARGLWTQAAPALSECLALAKDLGNEQLSTRPVFFKALMTTFASPPDSLIWIDRALKLARKYKDLRIEALSLAVQGQVLAQIGDAIGARQAIQSARDVAERLASPLTESDVDLMAAWAYLAIGEPEQALFYGHRSVEKAIATDNMECICSGLACIGYSHLELSQIQQASAAFEKGIERSETSGAMISRLTGQAGLDMVHFINGQRQAVEELRQVIAEMHRFQNETGAANATMMLANCYSNMADYERAEILIKEAIVYYRKCQMEPFLARGLFLLSHVEERLGRLSDARFHQEEANKYLQR